MARSCILKGYTHALDYLLREKSSDVSDTNMRMLDARMNTLATFAASIGRLNTLKVILKHRPLDINGSGPCGNTPLHCAIIFDHFEIARLLLESPLLQVNTQNTVGQTALFIAVAHGCLWAVDMLFCHEDIDPNLRNNSNRSPFHEALVGGKNRKIFDRFIHDSRVEVDTCDSEESIVTTAARWGSAYKLKAFLKCNRLVKDGLFECRVSKALHFTCFKAHIQKVRVLLSETKIDVNTHGATEGEAPIFSLLRFHECNPEKRHKIARLLLKDERTDVHQCSKEGHTLLTWAAEKHHMVLLKHLLTDQRLDVNAFNRCTPPGNPLISAIRSGNTGAVKFLLSLQEINPNACLPGQMSAISVAASLNNGPVVKLLMEHPRVNMNAKDSRGRTPLYIAISLNKPRAIAEVLNSENAELEVNTRLSIHDDPDGLSLLHMAVRWQQIPTVFWLLQHPKVRVNEVTAQGDTILHLAAQKGHAMLITDLLADNRLYKNAPNYSGTTPLAAAVTHGHLSTVRVFLADSAGVTLKCSDIHGRNVLHVAVDGNHLEIIDVRFVIIILILNSSCIVAVAYEESVMSKQSVSPESFVFKQYFLCKFQYVLYVMTTEQRSFHSEQQIKFLDFHALTCHE